jgi:hypothetical protein
MAISPVDQDRGGEEVGEEERRRHGEEITAPLCMPVVMMPS